MTDWQRNMIRQMRLKGYGYKAIRKATGLKENSVYEFCKHNGLFGNAELVRLNYPIWCEQNNRCRYCGKKLQQPKLGRRRRFCSGSCRTRFCVMKKNMEE